MMEKAPLERWQRPALVALGTYALLLLAGTHVPQPPEKLLELAGSDKWLHLAAYGVLALLAGLNLALRGWFRASRLVAAWLALAALAAVDEATQPLVGREADRLDWYADLAGLAAGLAVIATGLLIWRRHRRGTQATV